jgi:hypothetical protein
MRSVPWIVEFLVKAWEDYRWAFNVFGLLLIITALILTYPLFQGFYDDRPLLTDQRYFDVRAGVPENVIPGKVYYLDVSIQPGPQLDAIGETLSLDEQSSVAHSPPASATQVLNDEINVPFSTTITLESNFLHNPEGENSLTISENLGDFSEVLRPSLPFKVKNNRSEAVSASVRIEWGQDNVIQDEVVMEVNRLSMALRYIFAAVSVVTGILTNADSLLSFFRKLI